MPETGINPLFTVIIPAFNARATLAGAIESVLSQTFEAYELVVVDDGSTDDTLAIATEYKDRAVVIHQQNRGAAAARNAGAKIAKGEWLAFLDADDSWINEKLARVAAAIDPADKTVLIFSDAFCVNSDRTNSNEHFMPTNLRRAPTRDDMMAGRFQILTSTTSVRRSAFVAAKGFSEEFTSADYEDNYLWLILSEQGSFKYIDEPLVNYLVTPLDQRLDRYRAGFKVFVRMVRARYGQAGESLIKARKRARVNRWAHLGLLALRDGDLSRARRALGNAVREDPWRLKNLLRYARTYLPREVARALTGRTPK